MAQGWAAPTVVDPAPVDAPGAPDALSRFVDGLAALPGAEYVLVVDAEGERVRGETGGPPEADLAVLAWARRVASVSRERRQSFEDLVLTTATAFHLVRLVAVDPEAPESDAAWVTVRIDRARGNLAWSRRTLAGLGAPGATAGPRALTATPARDQEPAPGPAPAGRAPTDGPARGGGTGTIPPPDASTAPPAHPPFRSSSPAVVPDSHRPSPRFAPFEPAPPSAPWPRPAATSSWPTSPPPRAARFPDPDPRDAGPRSFADRPVVGPPLPRTPDDPANPGSGAFPAAMPTGEAPGVPAPRPAGPDERPRTAWPRLEDREAAVTRGGATGEGTGHAWPRLGDRPATPALTPLAEISVPPPPMPEQGETPAARRLPLNIRQAARWRDDADEQPAAPDGWVPAARTSAESAPAVPAPRAGSLFTPAVPTSPPAAAPPAPTPAAPTPAAPTRVTLTPARERDDDTGEMDLPLRASAVITPRPYAPKPGRAPAPEPWPAATTPPPEPDPDPDPSDDLPDLPRRRPGANLAPGLPATPRSAPTVNPVAAVAGTAAFSTEHSVLRRLLDGLRRLS